MSSPERLVAIATSGNVTYFGISPPPEHLVIADLPVPPPFGKKGENLGDVPLSIYPRYFDAATEIGFADSMFPYDGSRKIYGAQIAEFIGGCLLYPKMCTIVKLDPNLSIFEHKELEQANKSFKDSEITYSARLRNRLHR